MDYVQITDMQRQEMLNAIGVERVEDLFATMSDKHRLDGLLDLPPAKSELELQQSLATLAGRNRPAAAADASCFLGGGAYDHFIPAAVDHLAHQGTFVTAYTPYQAEASQGSLQAFFEFQTQVCRLTGLDVSNASLYEGATAIAEAILLALNSTGKRNVIVAGTLNPDYRAVIDTYLNDLPVNVIEVAPVDGKGTIDPAAVAKVLDEGGRDNACVVVQSPNVYGLLEDWSAIFEKTHESEKTLAIAVFNPIACGLFKRPGDCGADIAAAEGQPLGIPLQYGGPWLGLFAASQKLMRKMPGRLVGQTSDGDGNRGFCLTLQTREQHIRGAKATSNVCTNQGLLALRATVYMTAMGPQGLRDAASHCYHKAHYVAAEIARLPGYSLAYEGDFFHEFVVDCPVPAQQLIDAGRERRILPGLDCAKLGIGSDSQLLVAVTEKRTRAEIDALVQLMGDVG